MTFDPTLPALNETEVEHYCFGCGSQNPYGLKLRFRRSEGGIWADFTPLKFHEGYLGMTHGGILSTVADETMSWAVTDSGEIAVTARMTMTFRRPARVGETLRSIGRVVTNRGRAIDTEARIISLDDGKAVAEASARFIRVSPEQAREWRDAYGADEDESPFGEAMMRRAAQ